MRTVITVLVFMLCSVRPALAGCQKGSFSDWLDNFRNEAKGQGISARTLANLDGVRFDQSVISADRAQQVFAQNFLQFSDRMANGYRTSGAQQRIRKYKAVFDRIDKEYGVPAPVITAFWGLETDFGANIGKFKTLQSLATLAYDCRRPEQFRPELVAALKVLDRGDLPATDLMGAWAGEIGQMQFVPSYYFATAVDYDGDGRRNLVRSALDVLGSTANLLHQHGWKPGEPWLEEVRVPEKLPWEQADLAIKHPRSQWAAWGVTLPDGKPLPSDSQAASLLLPMGRLGPAFLAYPNFNVYTKWNRSLVYATTAAYLATRIAGARKVSRGHAPTLGVGEVKELQKRLEKAGFDVGGVDGTVGVQTRAAVRQLQQKFGMPADAWPTAEFMKALRNM